MRIAPRVKFVSLLLAGMALKLAGCGPNGGTPAGPAPPPHAQDIQDMEKGMKEAAKKGQGQRRR